MAGISQVIVMTKIDEICPPVKENLRNVYKSKKIKEKVSLPVLNMQHTFL